LGGWSKAKSFNNALEIQADSVHLFGMTTRITSIALLLVVFGLGCGKGSKNADSGNAVGQKVEGSSSGAGASSDMQPLLNDLTQQARKYGMEQQKAPKDLNELVAKGYLSAVPQPPPGKKFEITRKLDVILTDQ
jgi:hypothetical protein